MHLVLPCMVITNINDNMKKNDIIKKHTDTERIDLSSLFYRFCCLELRFDQSN